MSMIPRSFRLAAAVLALTGLSGCATMIIPWTGNKIPQATASNPVVQIVCLWEQAEGRDPEGVPCRGFAGQILFLANRHATPVEVHGDVRIYLFDNVGSAEEQSKPLRQFDFSSDAWKLHLTKSAVGPSYSVFVPYVRRGQHNAQCSLRVRLAPKDGPTIFSETSTLPLRGPGPAEEVTVVSATSSPEDRVQAEVNQALSKAMQKTTTIPLAISQSGSLAVAPQTSIDKTRGEIPASGHNATDDRLERMEKLLEQVLAERALAPSSAIASTGVRHANYETISPPAETDDEPPRRFKLNRSDDGE
jgi:hypothetical protein